MESLKDCPDLLWTYADVADYLSVSRRTVERMKERGEMPRPVSDRHKHVRWLESDIINWAKKRNSRQ